jgi:beta-glucanase (GH16 family)
MGLNKKLLQARFENAAITFVNTLLQAFHKSKAERTGEKIDTDAMDLTFEDHFDGDTLNTDIWRAHNAFGVRKGGFWSGSQLRVENSNLIITTEYLENGEFGPAWYTSGIETEDKFEQAFGYFECRCKLAKGQGLWSAFWMMNANVNKVVGHSRNGAEIDIFESPFWFRGENKRNLVTLNLHYNGYGLHTRYKNVGIFQLDNDPYENYNTYGVKWTPDAYTFYINGYPVAKTSWGGVSQKPEYLILSCEVDGGDGTPTFGWSGNIEKNDKMTFRAEYKVDYVRAYRLNQIAP